MAHLGNTIVNGTLRVLSGANIDTINGVAVTSSPKFSDHEYTAGTGLTLNSGAFSTYVPRVNQDANAKPGVNRFTVVEYGNSSTNVPNNRWNHIISIEGSDSNYATEIAATMTGLPAAHYRRCDGNNWSEWYRITRALLQRYQNGTITNGTWYRLFTIKYTSYNYVHVRLIVKAGYDNMYEVFLCLRYGASGTIDTNNSFMKAIPFYSNAGNIKLYKIDDTTFGLAVRAYGPNSDIGFEILDMTSESNQVPVTSVSVDNPFVALDAAPTAFGSNVYLTGKYSDISGTPSLNYLPLSGGTMTGVLTAQSSQYGDGYSGALNMNNSNIYGLNSIYTADVADSASEGIHFYRDATHVDTLWMNGGDLLFVPNRELGTGTTKDNSQKVGRFTANPTTGQVVITDGTTGGMKSSGYTIAASVPSGAKFTDTTYTFAGGTNSFTVTPSGASAQTVSITVSDSTKLPLTGGSLSGGLEVKGVIAGDSGTTGHGLYGGGGYHNAYNNILLHGDKLTGTSGIAFVSDKSDNGTITTINQPSDRAFIQYHAYGISTATAEGTNPTLATTGENGRLVIGIGNDATDQLWLQTPARTGLIHQVAAASYVIPDTNNTTGSVGSATQPVYVDGGAIKGCTYTLAKSVPSDADFTNTWRPVQDNLTSDSATDSLSAKQGKALANGSARDSTKLPLAGGTMTGTINSTVNTVEYNFRPGHNDYDATLSYQSAGNEALVLSTKNPVTSIIMVNGEDTITNISNSRWQAITPGIQLKNNCVAINYLWTNNTTPDYRLRVGGGAFIAGNTIVQDVLGIQQTGGTSGGISLYGGSGYVNEYGIAFRKTSNWGTHGSVTSDWATYFTMSNTNNRGWVFRRYGSGNVASIDTNGNEVINGSMTIGGNAANTTGAKISYNTSNDCIDFTFVA